MPLVTIDPSGPPLTERRRTFADYGGSVDKADSETEGITPYAYGWYREFKNMRGSAYRADMAGLVHAENLAFARQNAAVTRSGEKLAANRLPGTSDEKLQSWINALAVDLRQEDRDSDIRQRAAAKFRAVVGPTLQNEDDSIADMLGEAFVRTWRIEGVDLATPPTQTFWPGVNPGPVGYSLGGGAWLSERAHLTVEVQQPATMTDTDFLTLTNVYLFDLLDAMLPAWATFNWAIGLSFGCFILDVSRLDFTGLC